ncbi:MAG: metallophosphoesterase [Candidatus Accumulibacter sp.]|jgi:predicted MPP superfamily phosphohydrolase|nr:metallophosphoesterase [Accumulibacter sp.]
MFHAFSGLICLYIVCRLVPALPWPLAGKCLAVAALLLASQVHLISRAFFGTIASPELPFAVIVVWGWLFGALFLLFIFLLLKDLGALLLFALGKATGVGLSLPVPAIYWSNALIAAALGLSAIGVWQAIRVPDVRAVEIALDRLPAELDGLRLVQLSDLHASRLLQGAWHREVVNETNALNPDLILITGDLVDGTPANRAADVAPLRDLKARLGVLAVPGNHEYYSDYVAWMAAFDKLGLRMLSNRHVVIEDKGHALVVAGTTDRNAARFGLPPPDIGAALSGAPKDAVTLLLAHQPREAPVNAEAGVDLQLSGHTHGGQIAGLHFIVQKANGGFVSGLYRVGAMRLYVSNGTGLWNGFPIRLGRPSEITLITLRSVASGKAARRPA